MIESQQNNLVVARLLKRIREKYESAQFGLTGLAYGTGKHEVITKKMEKMGKLHEELQSLTGDEVIDLLWSA